MLTSRRYEFGRRRVHEIMAIFWSPAGFIMLAIGVQKIEQKASLKGSTGINAFVTVTITDTHTASRLDKAVRAEIKAFLEKRITSGAKGFAGQSGKAFTVCLKAWEVQVSLSVEAAEAAT